MLSLNVNRKPRGENPYNIWGGDPNNDIWEGRKPHHLSSTGTERYEVWFGAAEIDTKGNVVYANVTLNFEVSVFVLGDYLSILDNRGPVGVWQYTNTGKDRLPATPRLQYLSADRIEQILRPDHIDHWIWHKTCSRALELYHTGVNAE